MSNLKHQIGAWISEVNEIKIFPLRLDGAGWGWGGGGGSSSLSQNPHLQKIRTTHSKALVSNEVICWNLKLIGVAIYGNSSH